MVVVVVGVGPMVDLQYRGRPLNSQNIHHARPHLKSSRISPSAISCSADTQGYINWTLRMGLADGESHVLVKATILIPMIMIMIVARSTSAHRIIQNADETDGQTSSPERSWKSQSHQRPGSKRAGRAYQRDGSQSDLSSSLTSLWSVRTLAHTPSLPRPWSSRSKPLFGLAPVSEAIPASSASISKLKAAFLFKFVTRNSLLFFPQGSTSLPNYASPLVNGILDLSKLRYVQ